MSVSNPAQPRTPPSLRITLTASLLVLASACTGDSGPSLLLPNVRDRLELGRPPACPDNEGCISDYQDFIELAAPRSRPISERTLDDQLASIANGQAPVLDSGLPEDRLRASVLEGLNVGFLVEGLDARPLDAITVGERDTQDFHETQLQLVDPYVGEIEALLLRPHGPGPFPAVVAVHGHGDDAATYRDSYHGGEYPGHGYAILMLTMRAMGIVGPEHDVSRELLLHGFTLIGLRSYESLLGLKYLRHRADVRPDAIGLIGHSGGSSTGNLTIRVMDPTSPERFQAYVSDHDVDFFSSSPTEPYHCETVPALYPYHAAINDLAAPGDAPIPVAVVIYGYPFGSGGIFRFFDRHLKP